MNLLHLAAVVLFILAAIFLFAVDTITVRTDLGIIAVGLACYAAAVWAPSVPVRR